MLGAAAAASPTTTTEEHTHHEVFNPSTTTTTTTQRKKNKNKNKNSRRFSDEQIKSLESLFKMENKLEPRKKLEMARELGLHPRQVAIWFQNRRARWKSKQVEQDYTTLKADYDSLSDRFESLKKEKHALLKQLRHLCSQLKEPHEGSKDLDSGSENGDTNFELNGNSSGLSGPLEQDMAIYSDEDDPIKHNSTKLGHKEEENLNLGDQVSEEAHETLSNFDLGGLFDQPCGACSNWWDFWS